MRMQLLAFLTFCGLHIGLAYGDFRVGNGGDIVEMKFTLAKVLAVGLFQSANIAAILQQEQLDGHIMAQDLTNSNLIFVHDQPVLNKNNIEVAIGTNARRSDPILVNVRKCEALNVKVGDAMMALLHETFHHMGVIDEEQINQLVVTMVQMEKANNSTVFNQLFLDNAHTQAQQLMRTIQPLDSSSQLLAPIEFFNDTLVNAMTNALVELGNISGKDNIDGALAVLGEMLNSYQQSYLYLDSNTPIEEVNNFFNAWNFQLETTYRPLSNSSEESPVLTQFKSIIYPYEQARMRTARVVLDLRNQLAKHPSSIFKKLEQLRLKIHQAADVNILDVEQFRVDGAITEDEYYFWDLYKKAFLQNGVESWLLYNQKLNLLGQFSKKSDNGTKDMVADERLIAETFAALTFNLELIHFYERHLRSLIH